MDGGAGACGLEVSGCCGESGGCDTAVPRAFSRGVLKKVIHSVTSGQLLNLSEPLFPDLSSGNSPRTHLGAGCGDS